MSPRAASRLESLGFEDVWDYTAGKAEWSAFGLPMAGRQVAVVADAMRPDVPSCGLLEPVSVALERMAEAGWTQAAVVNDEGILLGRLRRAKVGDDPDAPARRVMEPGPGTYRPDVPLEELVERMKSRGFESALITHPDGRLVGILGRQDAEKLLLDRRS